MFIKQHEESLHKLGANKRNQAELHCSQGYYTNVQVLAAYKERVCSEAHTGNAIHKWDQILFSYTAG